LVARFDGEKENNKMTASFPGSVKNFGSERVDGEYIPAADMNALRAEVAAIESALLARTRVSSAFAKTSDSALANVPGLAVTVTAGRTYQFRATLFTTSNAAGGVKAAIGGSCTAAAIIYEGIALFGSITHNRAAALGAAVAAVTAVTAALIQISGSITVSAGGTLTVQFAQNAGNVAASIVLVGSTFEVENVL
jgi:hypothetical protein